MNLDITESVNHFREVIAASWPVVEEAASTDTTGSFIDDWLQANWERLVEASIHPSLNVVLEPYGDGADCNISSSRVWRPDLLPNASVYIRHVGNDPLLDVVNGCPVVGQMMLSHFCTLHDGWPVVSAPFDHVTLELDDLTVIPVDYLRYYVDIPHNR
jgi:hypothetical protein